MGILWAAERPLLLASTSQTRRALLAHAGIVTDVESSGVDERAIEMAAEEDRLDPPALAERLATEKALAVSRRHPDRLVLGADQVLDHAGGALHKPLHRAQAKAHLQLLAGRTHALHSAIALAQDGRIVDAFQDKAELSMRSLTDEAIDIYLDAVPPEVLQNAGVYQVEGLGIHLFERIEGEHSTILGLPLVPCLAALRRLGCLTF
jgi:nucleoside triphosphate pyrophosphatase